MTTFEFTVDNDGVHGDYFGARPGTDEFKITGDWTGPIYSFVGTGPNDDTWTYKGRMNGWTLKMLAFDTKNNLWCVGTDGNVGQWNNPWNYHNGSWQPHDNMGNSLDMIAFDITDLLWSVHDQDMAGYWQTWDTQSPHWANEGHMAGWYFKMLAFHGNSMWCVNTAGKLGVLSNPSPDHWIWTGHGSPDGKTLRWITFDANGLLWCVTDQGDFYTWSKDKGWTRMGRARGVNPAALVFTPDPKQTWCVDEDHDVVQWKDASESLAGVQTIEPNRPYTIPSYATHGLYYLTTTPFPLVPNDRERETANGKLNVGSGPGK